jgi:hypothetical protein
MVSAQHIIRLIDTGGEVRRPPLVGMNFLHESGVEVCVRRARSPHKVGGLMGFIGRLFATRQTLPRYGIALRVFTPSGMPAVKVRCR